MHRPGTCVRVRHFASWCMWWQAFLVCVNQMRPSSSSVENLKMGRVSRERSVVHRAKYQVCESLDSSVVMELDRSTTQRPVGDAIIN